MWEWIRYRALVLAVLPFIVGTFLWFLYENGGGWDKLRFFIVLVLSMPLLAGLAAFSVLIAFRKDDGLRKLKTTSKFASILSLTVFGGLVLIGTAAVIQSLWF